MQTKTLTLQLTATAIDKRYGNESLGELLGEAVKILNPDCDRETASSNAQLIARRAVRAVCGEIIRRGYLTLPLEVSYSKLWQDRQPGFRFQAGRN
jgi:hypothetical protein